jgi:hypothetical protein
MWAAVQIIKELSSSRMSPADAFDSLRPLHLDAVETKVLALAARIIFSQNSAASLKVNGLLNNAGFLMTSSSSVPATLKSSLTQPLYYCGRDIEGEARSCRCGPSNSQCSDCRVAQQVYMNHLNANAAFGTSHYSESCNELIHASFSSVTLQKLQIFHGDYVNLQAAFLDKAFVCAVAVDETCPRDCIRLSPRACAKLRLRLGDYVTVQMRKVSFGKRILYRVVRSADAAVGATALCLPGVVLCVGDLVTIKSGDIDSCVEIISTDPEGACMVTSETGLIPDGNAVDQSNNPVQVPSTASAKIDSFPCRGDCVRLQRLDGSISTLLRKRATQSRYVES